MEFTSRVSIAAPRTRVFEVFTDIAHAADRITGIESVEFVSAQTSGVGTRWKEARRMYGRVGVEELEITDLVPNVSYLVEAEQPGVKYRTEFRFDDAEAGTQVTMTFGGVPTTTTGRVLAFLTKPLVGSVRKAMSADLADLKRYCESA